MSEPTTVGPNQPNMAIFRRNLDHVLQQLGGEWRRGTASVVRGCRQLSFEDVEQPGSAGATVAQGSPSSHVFTAPGGGPLRVPGFRARFWVPATRAAGLQGLRIHDLRHTAVALWIAAGATPKEVAVRAGHTSVSFTLDRYGHLYPESDTTLRDRLEALHATARSPSGVVIQFPQ